MLKGVSIGVGTLVGAGSLVSKSLPSGVVATGVPARVIREINFGHNKSQEENENKKESFDD